MFNIKMFNTKEFLNFKEINFKNMIFPSEIEINISRICNLKCEFCPHSNKDYQLYNKNQIKFMSFELFKKIVDEVSKFPETFFTICGFGEPSLHPDFKDFLKYIRKLNKVRIISNINILNVINPENFENFEFIISIYKDQELKEFKNVKYKEMFGEILKTRYLNSRSGILEVSNNNFKTCNYPFYFLFIDTNGDVQFCSHNWKKEIVIGNVLDYSLQNIWNSEKFIRNKMLNNERQTINGCNKCDCNGCLIGNKNKEYFKNLIGFKNDL